jgi:hypothetical protein
MLISKTGDQESDTTDAGKPDYAPEPCAVGTIQGDYLVFNMPGGEGHGRSITGPTDQDIRTNGVGLRNVYQIIAIDAADPDANIWDFDEETDTTNSGYISLRIQIRRGHTYHILILGGYQGPESLGSDGTTQDKVLLTAGYSKTMITESASELSVSMYSLVPDIRFEGVNKDDATDTEVMEPDVGPAIQLTSSYNWQVIFSLSGNYGDPLQPLKTAEAVTGNWSDGTRVSLNSGSINYWSTKTLTGVSKPIGNSTDGRSFSLYISEDGEAENYFTQGETGYVYFDLCVSPFGYGAGYFGVAAGGNDKYHDKKNFIKNPANLPKWHIRNGLNFLPQDSDTWFGALSGEHADGNRKGALPLVIADPTHGGQIGGVYPLNVLSMKDSSGHLLVTGSPLVSWAYNPKTKEFNAPDAGWGATPKPESINEVLGQALAWCKVNQSSGLQVDGKQYFTISLDARIVNGSSAFNTGGPTVIIEKPDYKLASALTFDEALNINLVGLNTEGNEVAAITLDGTVAPGTSIISIGGTNAMTLTLGDGIVIEGNINVKDSGTLILDSGTTVMNFGSYAHEAKVCGSTAAGVSLTGSSGKPASLVLKNGFIMGNKGGGVELNNFSTVLMSGGTITENYTAGSGAGLNITSTNGTQLYLSGGRISKNTAGTKGGGINIPVGSTSTFYMIGGVIAGDNTVQAGGTGNGASFAGGRINFTSPDGTTTIKAGVQGSGAGAIYYPDEGGIDHFLDGNAELQIAVRDSVQPGQAGIYWGWAQDNSLSSLKTELPEVSWVLQTSGAHQGEYRYFGAYPIAALPALSDGYDDAANLLTNALALCQAFKTNRADDIPGMGLTIVLDGDVSTGGGQIQIDGTYPSINMAGWKDGGDALVSLNSVGTLIEIQDGGDFKLRTGVSLVGIADNGGNNSPLVAVSGGSFQLLSGGTITGNDCTTSTNGGGGVLVYNSTGTGGTFTMDGGTISNCTVAGNNGGGLCVKGLGQAELKSGTISGCIVTNGMGGAVYVEQTNKTPALSLSGVNIAGNKADKGGGLALNNGGTVKFSAGTIGAADAASKDADANSADLGGGVYIKGAGSFTLSNTVAISYNTATTAGGGLYLDGVGDMTFVAGTLGYNTASGSTSNGGGVYINGGSGTVSFSGMMIGNNTAGGNGGGIYTTGAVNLDASTSASSIYSNNANLGGGLYVDGGAALQILGAGVTIQGNSAGIDGGGLYVLNGTVTHTHGTIQSNTATLGEGGGVFVDASQGSYTMEYDTATSVPLITGKTDTNPNTARIPDSAALNGTVVFPAKTYGVIGGEENDKDGGSQTSTDLSITVKNVAKGMQPDTYYWFYDNGVTYKSNTTADKLKIADIKGQAKTLAEAVDAVTPLFGTGDGKVGKEIVIGVPSTKNNSKTLADFKEAAGVDITLGDNSYELTIVPMGDGKALSSSDYAIIQCTDLTNSLITLNKGKLNLNGSLSLIGPSGTSFVSLVTVVGGTFTMNSGTIISGNTTRGNGGGLSLNGGTFTMNSGATISGNSSSANGGGVSIGGGTFTMNTGSKVTGNNTTGSGNGGGVSISNGTFTMNNGAVLSSNTSSASGGGVYMTEGTFNMNGGDKITKIESNNAKNGAGVYMTAGKFTMGTSKTDSLVVCSNTADSNGGGIYVSGGKFKMSGGLIYGNSASAGDGGGVYALGSGVFTFNGGYILGTWDDTGSNKKAIKFTSSNNKYGQSSYPINTAGTVEYSSYCANSPISHDGGGILFYYCYQGAWHSYAYGTDTSQLRNDMGIYSVTVGSGIDGSSYNLSQ